MTDKLIDIGANLCHKAFDQDLQEVIHKAHQAAVKAVIVTGSDVIDSRHALTLTQTYPGYCFATAGVHPHYAEQWDKQSLSQLKHLAQQETVCAIGEAGLDYNRNYATQVSQRAVLEAQLELAIELDMPIFLHVRDAHQVMADILTGLRQHLRAGVIHCFTGEREDLYRYLDLDMHIGITGWICDERRGYHLHNIVKDIPPDRLMIETDAPYLIPRDLPTDFTPKLASKRRNEPCTLKHIAQTVAQYCGRDMTEVAQQTSSNACRFFGLPLKHE